MLKNYSEADLVEVLEPSEQRVEPKCPLFGQCGGCQYQHLAYAGQLEWKTVQVRELFEHIGGVDCEVLPAIGSPKEYFYRSELTPHYPKKRDGKF
jgi:23S rRNA (uracil1939-C5)-methyltransferase/tRNA (uracil-5-)-methyltransferase